MALAGGLEKRVHPCADQSPLACRMTARATPPALGPVLNQLLSESRNRGVFPQKVTDAETGEMVGGSGGADSRLPEKTTPACQPQPFSEALDKTQRDTEVPHNHPGQAQPPGPGAPSPHSTSKCSKPDQGGLHGSHAPVHKQSLHIRRLREPTPQGHTSGPGRT